MRMSEIFDLIEGGKVKDAMNIIKRQDRIRGDDIRLGQMLVNKLDEEHKDDGEHKKGEMLNSIFFMEDREFLKLIFE